MNKITKSLTLALILGFSSVNANNLQQSQINLQNLKSKELTGDTKLACEAILCLSTGNPPSECNPSLRRFYSISAKKMADTIRKRKSFLNLCPVNNASDDLVLKNLTQDILPSANPEQCKPEYLNQQIQTKTNNLQGIQQAMFFRVNPNLPKHCQALINHAYTDYKIPTYKCSGEFYSKLEWSLSAKLQSIDYATFSKLNPNQSYKIFNQCRYDDTYSNCNDPYNQYFKKIPFTKKCWSY